MSKKKSIENLRNISFKTPRRTHSSHRLHCYQIFFPHLSAPRGRGSWTHPSLATIHQAPSLMLPRLYPFTLMNHDPPNPRLALMLSPLPFVLHDPLLPPSRSASHLFCHPHHPSLLSVSPRCRPARSSHVPVPFIFIIFSSPLCFLITGSYSFLPPFSSFSPFLISYFLICFLHLPLFRLSC